jgi:ribosome-associated protein
VIRPGVFVPADALQMHATRASGPGGQNVNKVSSKVELRLDPGRITGLSPAARQRLSTLAVSNRDADGWLLVRSQRTRDQRTNLEDAREKLRALVLRALETPRPRKKTRPSRGSVERRIEEKKHRARIKANRRGD